METNEFTSDENGTRLDVYLTKCISKKSRSFFQKLIEESNVRVNGNLKKSNYKVKKGDKVIVTIPDPKNLSVEAEDIKLDILYEDSDVIVVNKPQGMVVHPAYGNYSGTLVNALLNHCTDLSGINGIMRPGIVHRIDKDTSGVIVAAKNDYAHVMLSSQLKDHSMTRVYVALVEGVLKTDEGTIDKPLGRNAKDRKKFAVVDGGKKAVTHFKVIERFKTNTFIECRLETGRTHQIRVHMAYIGHPLVGDPVYGFKRQRFDLKGQMLHAKTLGFIHPTTKKYMEFSADIPCYFKKIINILKNNC